MENYIKNCPFCGLNPVVIDTGTYFSDIFYRIICPNNCCMQSKFYKTKIEAIEDWNKRAGGGDKQ